LVTKVLFKDFDTTFSSELLLVSSAVFADIRNNVKGHLSHV
jgi:hypothetical protein